MDEIKTRPPFLSNFPPLPPSQRPPHKQNPVAIVVGLENKRQPFGAAGVWWVVRVLIIQCKYLSIYLNILFVRSLNLYTYRYKVFCIFPSLNNE